MQWLEMSSIDKDFWNIKIGLGAQEEIKGVEFERFQLFKKHFGDKPEFLADYEQWIRKMRLESEGCGGLMLDAFGGLLSIPEETFRAICAEYLIPDAARDYFLDAVYRPIGAPSRRPRKLAV
jgi:hypothetical protein